MKSSQGIATDVNICFINYEMIKTHIMKTNWWHSLSQNLLFSLNYQQGVTVLYLYQQMRRDYKIKFTDKSKTNLWLYLDLTKVNRWNRLTSLYIISYLHFLKLIFWLSPKLFCSSLKLGLVWHNVHLVFCLADLNASALVFEIKTNASRLSMQTFIYWKLHTIHFLNRICNMVTQLWGQKNNNIPETSKLCSQSEK